MILGLIYDMRNPKGRYERPWTEHYGEFLEHIAIQLDLGKTQRNSRSRFAGTAALLLWARTVVLGRVATLRRRLVFVNKGVESR